MERIMIEPHILHISAEALTPELLEREEKMLEKQELQEKRRKERLEKLGRKLEDNISATSSRSSSIDDTVEESDTKTSSASTSRSATPTLKNGISIRRKSTDGKERPNKRRARAQLQPSSNEAKRARTTNIPSFSANQTALNSRTASFQDTILVRLSSGQIVRVPKSLLKRVATATGRPNVNLNKTQPLSNTATNSPSISSKLSFQVQPVMSAPPVNSNKPANQSISNRTSSISYTPVSIPFVSRLSEALEKLSFQKLSEDDKKVDTKSKQKIILNGILKKLADCAGNGRNNIVRTVKIRAYQGPKNSDDHGRYVRRDLGVGKLSLQIKKAEQKLSQTSQTTVHVPNLGISKQTLQPHMLMMSGGGNVTRVVIPKWLNVSLAPPSGRQQNIIAVSPTKQTQNIIRIRGPLPSRTQTHTQQNTMLNYASSKGILTPGSSLLLKENDSASSQRHSNVIKNVPISNSSALKVISGCASRTFVADINGVLKQQHQSPQELRVLQQQPPILLNNIASKTTVVNTLYKDTSGSPIVIKKSLVSVNSLTPPTATTLINVTSNNGTTVSTNSTTTVVSNNIGTITAPKSGNNVVIVENVGSSSKVPSSSFLKPPFLSSRQGAPQIKSSVPAVVMVSKVDHNSVQPKSEMAPVATSIISSSSSIQGEAEIYDKEL